MRPYLLAATISILLFSSGCAKQVISQESLRLADRTVSFAQLREKPDSFIDRHVIVGGTIARTVNGKEGGEVEVVQSRLDSDNLPDDTIHSLGRFLARSRDFLDPLIFRPGLKITLVGKVTGSITRPLDGVDYSYPILAIREAHLWKPGESFRSQPTFHFGIGIGHGF